MRKVSFNGQLSCGAFIYNASVEVSKDYTMIELANAIKELGFINFQTNTMKTLAKIY